MAKAKTPDHRKVVARDSLTEDEHIRMGIYTDNFCIELGRMAAKVLTNFPPEIRRHCLVMLQDATSLYSPMTADATDAELARLDKLQSRLR